MIKLTPVFMDMLAESEKVSHYVDISKLSKLECEKNKKYHTFSTLGICISYGIFIYFNVQRLILLFLTQ
jgi:hypothetical protein